MTTVARLAPCTLLLLLAGGAASAQEAAQPTPAAVSPQNAPTHPSLRDELLKMMKVEQWYRSRLSRETDGGLPAPDVLHEDMRAVDAANTKRVLSIVREHGWPGKSMVGPEGATAAFLIVQHARLDVQEEMISLLQTAVKRGEAEPLHLAYLTDRVRMRQGKKQIYGTQLTGLAGGPATLVEIEDPENVDKRRAAVGLGPIEDYVRAVNRPASTSVAPRPDPEPGVSPKTDLKGMPPGVTVRSMDGKPLPPGSKYKVVPLEGGAPIVKRSDGNVSVVAPEQDEEASDPVLRDALLKEPALTIATPENRPASAPPGETVMIAGPDDRLERLQREVRDRGWPGYDTIGRKASNSAFHVVRRAKTENIKELLPAIIAAAESGQASKIHAAFLEDLVRVREGLPQRYGTQVRRSASGGIELAPVEDAPGLDDRRAAIGLPPSAEFLASLRPPQ